MRFFFKGLALIISLAGLALVVASIVAVIAWWQEPDTLVGLLAVLLLLILVGLFGAIFFLAGVRFLRRADQCGARDVAGLFCLLLWFLLPRGAAEEAFGNEDVPLLDLVPLAFSILLVLLLYRLAFVPMIRRAFPSE